MTEFTKEQFEGENIKPGDRFTFYYSIPVHVAARPDQLQKDLTYYIKRVIDNPSIRRFSTYAEVFSPRHRQPPSHSAILKFGTRLGK